MIQIYSDEQNRVAAIEPINVSIEKTLATADATLSFDYIKLGEYADQLKEEVYIRTEADEYVLKEIQEGETYNKYIAVLNVETLEGKVYESGFETIEQTVKTCLSEIIKSTGWKIGTCNITKKRTIRKEEACTAWEVLQDLLKTYRVEIKLNSINKIIDVFEKIGDDRGCKFFEDVNLKKLTVKSDTYNFATRLIPIGKDGLHLWQNNKNYIENYQYSKKIITKLWIDQRYTNTTSLLEDAIAKLDEMSKPYKVYEAKIIDLTKCNDIYKDVYDFVLGDTVELIAKSNGLKEKMRIVKIKEYPASPEKNEIELSNTNKSFAEIQKQEQEITKTETINIVNGNLNDNYYTKEQTETTIKATADEIGLEVKKKVGSDEIISSINMSSEEIKIKAKKIKLEGIITMDGNFTVKEDGSIQAKNGEFSGKISASSGTIAGWNIDENGLYQSFKRKIPPYTANDYEKVKRYIMKEISLTEDEIAYLDANGDGKITSADYVIIKNYTLGISKQDWTYNIRINPKDYRSIISVSVDRGNGVEHSTVISADGIRSGTIDSIINRIEILENKVK